jgi:hypothetical protein
VIHGLPNRRIPVLHECKVRVLNLGLSYNTQVLFELDMKHVSLDESSRSPCREMLEYDAGAL